MTVSVRLVAGPLPERAAAAMDGDSGALVEFSGYVRDEGGSVSALFLEHYPGMTEKAMARLGEQARERWPLDHIEMIHRVGEIHTGEEIVRVRVAAAHRHAAFQACAFIMDTLKSRVPLWKKAFSDGAWHWVEARDADARAAERWLGGDPD